MSATKKLPSIQQHAYHLSIRRNALSDSPPSILIFEGGRPLHNYPSKNIRLILKRKTCITYEVILLIGVFRAPLPSTAKTHRHCQIENLAQTGLI